MMFESEENSRTSNENDAGSQPNWAAPTPTDTEQEDPPSLELLEESAAQLAALRQRAEYLLEQLSPGRADGRSRDDFDAKDTVETVQEPLREAREDDEKALEWKTTSELYEPSFPVVLDNDNNSGSHVEAEQAGRDLPSLIERAPIHDPPPAESDGSPSDPESSETITDPLAHQRSSEPAFQYSGMSSSDDDANDQPDVVPPLLEVDSAEAYPIQRHRAQSSSLLDRPVGASQLALGQAADARFDVTATDVMVVEEEISVLFKAINRHRKARRENTGHALSLLREAMEIVRSEPHRIERAEYNIQQARLILERATLSRRHSRLLALRTVWRLILWLAFLGGLGAALQLYPQSIDQIVGRAAARLGWEEAPFVPALWAIVAGGAGGCLGSISFLVERMRIHQEFDDQYILRTTIQPLMGVVLGLIVFAILAAVFNSLGIPLQRHPLTTFLPAAFALPVGLWQEYVYALIFRLTQLLTFQRRRRW